MKNIKAKFLETFSSSFKSQDSKYFIKTALKVTSVPIISFSIIFYALWNILEMNYRFFIANTLKLKMMSDNELKDALYSQILLNVDDYIIYFGVIIISVFFAGLFISHLALRPFKEIENLCYDLEEDPSAVLKYGWMDARKIIYQAGSAFFNYLNAIKAGEKVTEADFLPEKILKMRRPKTDKVFLIQYSAIVSMIVISTSIVFYNFTVDLHQQIVDTSISLLNGSAVVAKFMPLQTELLFNIYSVAIGLNILFFLGLSKNIIKEVDGVTFAFTRDFIQVLRGSHRKRIFTRLTDPGQEAALACNNYLDFIFRDESDEIEIEIEIEETIQRNHIAQNDLPPVYVEQKLVSGSDIQLFNLTTPQGEKIENLDKKQLLKLMSDNKNEK